MAGLLQFIFGAPERKSDPAPLEIPVASENDIRRDLAASHDTAGEPVNRHTAMEVSAVMACARVISEGLAQVPCRVFREDDKGSPVPAQDHALYDLLNRKPNDWQTSFEFREQIGLHLTFDNNAFVYINRVGKVVKELYAFTPESVTVTQNSSMELAYRVQGTNSTAIDVPAEDMWHIRGPSWNGYRGLNAVHLAKRSIGLSLATEKYGAKLFENGARPGGILTTRSGTQALNNEQRAALKAMWQEQHQGTANAHKTVLMPFEMEFTAIGGTANDAQWIESRRFLIEEICRFFRVLPIMVNQSDNSTSYASVEQLFQAHLTHTLMPWYERFEQSADAHLLTADERSKGYCVKLNSNALLRGSTAERSQYYQTMITLGVMTPNEVRSKEDMPRSDDPQADKLNGAANLFGGANKMPNQPAPGSSQSNDTNEVDQ
ncbi:phage portal protein [Sphingomonas aerophila]|uniref:HK97 family phage portal protein n=1 Tax=Sphingomonas aerophila TaxID=1344948 RepID=A0A7W9BFD1_9SPHN|nr:phage portal protein [Sphingomonas aerophila]MBB5715856.1 HK97 family phage portal protein [Sphingomonas aerophila]